MNLLAYTASLVIGIFAVLTFYTALLHITRKNVNNSYKFRIVRDLIVGIQSLQLCFVTLNMQLEYPFLLYPFMTLLFISGSLYYIRYFMFFYPGSRIPLRLILQMVPAAIILAGETWFYFIDTGQNKAALSSLFANPANNPVTLLLVAGVLVLLFQYVLLLRLESGFLNNNNMREPVRISMIITILYMADIALITAGFILANSAIMDSGIILIGLTGLTYLLFENRYPHFYQLVAREEKQIKYKKSLIRGLSTDKIMLRLQELMEEEKIYRQFELKLDEVAAMLLITPHQLSEFINDYMGINFSSYVNKYRVEEARELLAANPDQSTLSIGMEVGFGSKPSFNTIFKQKTGMTPSEYRKKGSAL
jgi:AraC-like DNA-binding protein